MKILTESARKLIMWFLSSKDRDLPLATRLLRWTLLVFCALMAAGYVAHCYTEWFIDWFLPA